MKRVLMALFASSVLSNAAWAAEKLVIAPAPDWVKPIASPSVPDKSDEMPVRLLLSDQQIAFEPGKQTVYGDVAFKIQTPQGLAAGNISFPWRPDTDTLTVHKVLIHRGADTIDILASGQTFTVVRREQNLENAMLDGVLTANLQPEGLQVGDILEFAVSVTSSDPVMQGHVEQVTGNWNSLPIDRAHLRIQWPNALAMKLGQAEALPALKAIKAGRSTSVELLLDNVKPIIPPKGAPSRYRLGRYAEVTDFRSWGDLAALMAPLYVKAAALPSAGPLRTELDHILAASADPKIRAEAALALVQDRVRYVALMMGAGGYVPADAELTWSRRFGDCKGKTALLLALLHGMSIQAEPVAVSTNFGDGLDVRLPMVGLFNHVLVRAVIGGRTYWLDGTRLGDKNLDRLTTPDFGWGLPLVSAGATLVRMEPSPLAEPSLDTAIHIDATAGLTIPAPTKIETILRGDDAISTDAALANLTGEARDRAFRDYWKNQFDFIDVKTASSKFDPKTGELRLQMEGSARMDWSSGWYETDKTGVGYKADFTRDPGADSDAPFAVPYPYYTRVKETILLPRGFSGSKYSLAPDVNETVAGVEYRRQVKLEKDIFTAEKNERSIVPEFPAKDAVTAQAALRKLAGQTVYLKRPAYYRPTEQETKEALATTLTTADAFLQRGNLLLDQGRYDDAVGDLEKAVSLDPKNPWALASLGIVYVWKADYDAANKSLDAAYAIDARNPVVFRARGLMAQRKGSFKDAIAAYTTAHEIEPNDSFALGHRAEVNHSLGNSEAALQDAAAALRSNPGWIDLYLLRANIFRSQGKRAEALNEASTLESANATSVYAHVAAANVYQAFQMTADALKAYDRAIAVKPEPYIYLNRSMRRPKEDVAARRADVDQALKLDPDYVEAFAVKAQLLEESRDFAGAVAIYSSALQKSPGNVRLLLGRGVAYARSGDTVRADKDFAAVRGNTPAPVDFNNLCWSKAIAGVSLESALADCNAALSKEREVAGFLDSRGLVLLRLGRIDDAIADYDHALAKRPDYPTSLFGRSVAWAKKGNKVKSDADAAAALKMDPDVQSEFESYGVTR